ncbi:MAG: hypothetical protein AB7V58_05620 [Solirubrobacterales bacterium]
MTKRVLALLFACLAIAAVAAGCGGGDDSTSSGDSTSGGESTEAIGSAPSKAAFIKEADKICGDADEAMNEEIGEYAEENEIPIEKEEPTQAQQVEIYEAVVLPNVAKQGEEIAALTPPAGDEEAIEEITDALAAGVEDAEADPKQLTEGGDPLADASKKARAYGLKTCGS